MVPKEKSKSMDSRLNFGNDERGRSSPLINHSGVHSIFLKKHGCLKLNFRHDKREEALGERGTV